MPRPTKLAFQALLIVLGVAAAACSNDGGDGQPASTGGAQAGGSGGGSGGSSGSGGSGSGGTRATGGTTSTGGSTGSGGEHRTGGATGTGGSSATGGSASSGGERTGGATGSGGTVAAGGTSAGGANTGGTTSAGGARTGGNTGTGGTGTGGTAGTGGGMGGAGGTGTGGTRADAGVDGPPDSGGDGGSVYNPCPTSTGTACNVLPIGDSITEGCCTAPMGGYRIELFRQATKNGKNLTFVGLASNGPSTVDGKTFPKKHEGHGGYTISQIAGLADNSIASSRPHIVILKIGTNDINNNNDIANAPKRLEGLIDQIIKAAPDALLVVSAIIPTKTDGTNQRVQAYNGAIPALVDARAKAGKHVVFVDNYKAYTQNTNYKNAYMADNLHPNDAGYAVLGQSFYDVIASVLPAAP